MADDKPIKFRKKAFNKSTDIGDGVITFDTITGKIYVGSVMFGSDVKSISSENGVMTIEKIDGAKISFQQNTPDIQTLLNNATAPLTVPQQTNTTVSQLRNITVSNNEPSGGNSGDIWIKI